MTDDAALALRAAEDLAAACSDALGDHTVAALLHGSLTLGDNVPGRSDVDLLVVAEHPLTDAQLDALRELVCRRTKDGPRGTDLRVVTRSVAVAPTPRPAMELYVGLHGRGVPEIETRVPGEPDLLVEFAMTRALGRSLLGLAPRTAIGPVPDEWVTEYGDMVLAGWERLTDDREHAELMVLTACRIWRLAVAGAYCSKTAAGRWALARNPSLPAVEGALRLRGGEPNVRLEPADIGHLLALVRDDVRRRLAAATPEPG